MDDVVHRIAQRERQIDIGKSTRGYTNYTHWVPHSSRKDLRRAYSDYGLFPQTPRAVCGSVSNLHMVSKRAFTRAMIDWRRALHRWDSADPTERAPVVLGWPMTVADSKRNTLEHPTPIELPRVIVVHSSKK